MNLLAMQRRMADDVRRPLTANYEMQATTESGERMDARAASYVKPNAQLSSFERLEIYNRQYWFRVIGAVSEDFPAVEAVLGAKRFDALVLAYLKENPSTSWTLRDLGAKLPEWLEAHPEYCGGRHRLTVDVARLEWAYVEAFDGKNAEPLTERDLQELGSGTRLSLQPHLQLLAVNYAVDELVLVVRKATPESEIVSSAASERPVQPRIKLPKMPRMKRYLAVHRFEDSVYYRPIEKEAFLLLSALRDSASIEESLERAFKRTDLSEEQQSIVVQNCFSHAAELGWFCPAEPK